MSDQAGIDRGSRRIPAGDRGVDLDRVVRRERGRLVADLVRHLGGGQVALAEDVAQEALLKALSTWPYRGTPDRPGAWLTVVARNQAYDRLRRLNREVPLPPEDVSNEISTLAGNRATASKVFEAQVEDPELRLVLLCCHDALTELERTTLTLNLACGFTARNISEAFLARENSIGQRIARAKRKLRRLGPELEQIPLRFGIEARIPSVLQVVYLMFSMGYAPQSGARSLRREVAFEALRLSREVAANELLGGPDAHALAALMSFQASRFDARESGAGDIVVLDHQDRSLWDRELIDQGFAHLLAAKETRRLSRYHVEAGIAACHASAADAASRDWQAIARQYDVLLGMVASPVIAINAAVAVARSGDPDRAYRDLQALDDVDCLDEFAPWHIACAEVANLRGRTEEAQACYRRALACRASAPVTRLIRDRLIA